MSLNHTEKENTKERIVKAFSKCIREKGIAAVTLRNIAQKADVSLGTVHYYFRSRENLIIELLNYELDFIEYDIRRRFNPLESPEKKILAILEEGKEFVGGDLWIAFVEIWTVALRNKKMKKSFASFYERLSALVGDVIAEGKEMGTFDDVKEDLVANSIIALVEGMGLQKAIRGKSAVHLTETFDFIIDSVMERLKKGREDVVVQTKSAAGAL